MKTTHQAMVIYTKGHNQHVVFTTPECKTLELARRIAILNMERLLNHASLLRLERANTIDALCNCNETSQFEPRIPMFAVGILSLQLARISAVDYIDMTLANCYIQYREIKHEEELTGFKVTSTFKYMELIHDVVGTKEEAMRVCTQVQERMRKRIALQEHYIEKGRQGFNNHTKAHVDTLYWLKRQLKEGINITPVTMMG